MGRPRPPGGSQAQDNRRIPSTNSRQQRSVRRHCIRSGGKGEHAPRLRGELFPCRLADAWRPARLCTQKLRNGLMAKWRRRWCQCGKAGRGRDAADSERHDRRMRKQGAKTALGGRVARIVRSTVGVMIGVRGAHHAVGTHAGHSGMEGQGTGHCGHHDDKQHGRDGQPRCKPTMCHAPEHADFLAGHEPGAGSRHFRTNARGLRATKRHIGSPQRWITAPLPPCRQVPARRV